MITFFIILFRKFKKKKNPSMTQMPQKQAKVSVLHVTSLSTRGYFFFDLQMWAGPIQSATQHGTTVPVRCARHNVRHRHGPAQARPTPDVFLEA